MPKAETYIPDEEVAKAFESMAANMRTSGINWKRAPDELHAKVLDAVLGVSDSILKSPDSPAEAIDYRPFPEPPSELLAQRRD